MVKHKIACRLARVGIIIIMATTTYVRPNGMGNNTKNASFILKIAVLGTLVSLLTVPFMQ